MARTPPTTMAFNAEAMRARMLEGLRPPADLVQHAAKKLREKLDAKETKFATYRGEITDRIEVEDHTSQLNAIDKVLSWAGLYAREREAPQERSGVAIEVDSRTGVVRMVLGATAAPDARERERESLPPAIEAAEAEQLEFSLPQRVEEVEAQVVRVPRGRMPKVVYDALFGPDDGNG